MPVIGGRCISAKRLAIIRRFSDIRAGFFEITSQRKAITATLQHHFEIQIDFISIGITPVVIQRGARATRHVIAASLFPLLRVRHRQLCYRNIVLILDHHFTINQPKLRQRQTPIIRGKQFDWTLGFQRFYGVQRDNDIPHPEGRYLNGSIGNIRDFSEYNRTIQQNNFGGRRFSFWVWLIRQGVPQPTHQPTANPDKQ